MAVLQEAHHYQRLMPEAAVRAEVLCLFLRGVKWVRLLQYPP